MRARRKGRKGEAKVLKCRGFCPRGTGVCYPQACGCAHCGGSNTNLPFDVLMDVPLHTHSRLKLLPLVTVLKFLASPLLRGDTNSD